MKKNLLLGALAAFTLASASAEDIYISGATAFRGTANDAIADFVRLRSGSITSSNNATLASATLLKATFTTNSAVHNIYVRWTGSEGGIQSCAGPRTGSNAVTVNFYNTNVAAGLQTGSTANPQVTHIAFSDTYQSTSLYGPGKKFAGVTYSTLSDWSALATYRGGLVGVNQFMLITGSNNTTASNITSMQARQLLGNGTIPNRQISGNTNDTATCYLIGRNSDSGTRLSVLGDVGYGANTKPQQYSVTSTTNISIWPEETINGLALTFGQSGYASGGDIAKVFTESSKYPLAANGVKVVTYVDNAYVTNSTTNASYVIGYAGVGDALAASGTPNANIKPLTFNGVSCTMDNIKNGTYSLWTYEHLYVNSAATPLAKAVCTALGTACIGKDSVANAHIKLSEMLAKRGSDGSAVFVSGY